MTKLLASALFLSVAFAETPTPEAIFSKPVQALGGEAAVAKISSQVRTGTFSFGPGSEPFPSEVLTRTGGKWQFTITIPGAEMLRDTSDGKAGWSQSSRGAEPMSDGEFLTEDCAFNLAALLQPGVYLSAPAAKAGERGDAWLVDAKTPAGKPIVARFDAATGLLTALGDVEFTDYRTVDGVQIPFTITARQGRRATVFQAATVRNNAPFADAVFEKSASEAAFRTELRNRTLADLNAEWKGINAPAVHAVLEDMHNFSPLDGRMLYDLIVSKGYKRGIEIGTAEGNSALWMGLAFQKTGGKLITLEMDENRAKVARENFRKAGLDQVVECRVNDAFKEIPLIEGEFDFVFMDTGTALHKKFMDLLYARVPVGGAITSHNANTFDRQMPDFLKAITTDPNLDTKITRTITGGLSVSLKKSPKAS